VHARKFGKSTKKESGVILIESDKLLLEDLLLPISLSNLQNRPVSIHFLSRQELLLYCDAYERDSMGKTSAVALLESFQLSSPHMRNQVSLLLFTTFAFFLS
jgi:hypothetical protein